MAHYDKVFCMLFASAPPRPGADAGVRTPKPVVRKAEDIEDPELRREVLAWDESVGEFEVKDVALSRPAAEWLAGRTEERRAVHDWEKTDGFGADFEWRLRYAEAAIRYLADRDYV